jgi:1-acyl-sn-glycerol-3-phosphate acyltransferase
MRNANCGSRAGAPAVRSTSDVGPLRVVFGIYTWLEFTLTAMLGLPVLLLTPGLARRRRFVRALARSALRLAGIRVVVGGIEELPVPCIVVANHCSYIDGVILTAALPPMFSFVIKREMSRFPVAGTLLRRIGSEFVDRADRRAAARDTRRLLRSAASGQALAFFPEGTFSEEVGLLRFHIGAFAAAARAHMPVVPVAIRGTRHSLPAGSMWPNPGVVEVEILPVLPASPLHGQSRDGDVATRLRDAARASILSAINEPDLTANQA